MAGQGSCTDHALSGHGFEASVSAASAGARLPARGPMVAAEG